FFELDTALTLLVERSRKHASKSESIAGIAKRTAALREDLSRIIDCLGSDYVAWVKWKGRRCTIGASPVDVSGTLRDELFHRARAVVLTSATLSTSGRFDFIRGRLGLADEDVAEFMAPSPFDYPRQAGLYVAGEIPDPRSTEYARIALKEIERLIRIAKGGAFVLCTSTRAMETLAVELRLILNSDYKILVQGEESKNTLLDRFRQDEGSVLVGTGTFWEGVDVPGNALRLVILDKLPFGVPTDPLVEARCSRLAAQGQAPFMKYLVPTAALALKQGFGRLIRSESDRGVVAILDSRLVKKGYGRLLLRSLPRARKCSTLDEVQYFFRHMQDDSVDREGSTPL
ncbi:MAG: ATP-dependent DNA helicase, partial [Myxococcota bacterium]